MSSKIVFLFLFAGGVLSTPLQEIRPQQFVQFDGKYYYFENNFNVDWYEASSFCRRLGASLVSIETKEENGFITEHIKQLGGAINYWTSGSNLAQTNQYTWHGTGLTATYFNWAADQPDNKEVANCTWERVIAVHGDEPMWHDFQPLSLRHVICEEDLKTSSVNGPPTPLVNLNGTVYFFEPSLQVCRGPLILSPFSIVNYYEASHFCRRFGMYLVSVETMEENKLIREHIGSFGPQVNGYWTSGNDLGRFRNEYVWASTGNPVTSFDWIEGVPDHGVKGCNEDRVIVFATSGHWNDLFPYHSGHIICEKHV